MRLFKGIVADHPTSPVKLNVLWTFVQVSSRPLLPPSDRTFPCHTSEEEYMVVSEIRGTLLGPV